MTVQEIIKKHLLDNGYDGLCGEDCACHDENLFHCEMFEPECCPAYRNDCSACVIAEDCACDIPTEGPIIYRPMKCQVPPPEGV